MHHFLSGSLDGVQSNTTYSLLQGNDKRKRMEPSPVQGMGPPPPKRPTLATSASAAANGVAAAGTATSAGAAAAAGVAAADPTSRGAWLLPEPPVLSEYSVTLGDGTHEVGAFHSHAAADRLTVRNSDPAQRGGAIATLTGTQRGDKIWVDAVPGQVGCTLANSFLQEYQVVWFSVIGAGPACTCHVTVLIECYCGLCLSSESHF